MDDSKLSYKISIQNVKKSVKNITPNMVSAVVGNFYKGKGNNHASKRGNVDRKSGGSERSISP